MHLLHTAFSRLFTLGKNPNTHGLTVANGFRNGCLCIPDECVKACGFDGRQFEN